MDIDKQTDDEVEKLSVIASYLIVSATEYQRLWEYVEYRCKFGSEDDDLDN